MGPPHPPQQNMPHGGPPPHFNQNQQGAPRVWVGQNGPAGKPGQPPFQEQPMVPQISEVEFEEIMTRNRTVSSSAIAR